MSAPPEPNPAEPAGLLLRDPVAAAGLLRRGGLVGLPTETVYGLAADARNPQAVARVFAAKGRPVDHPLIVHVRGVEDLDAWGHDVPEHARALAARFWPGPLTLVVPRREVAGDHVTGGQDTVGLRAPAHPVARAVLDAFAAAGDGSPGGASGLAAPSANRFGKVSPTTAAHVLAELAGHLVPGVDAVLDGGPSQVGVESTIVDCTGDRPRVLRPGAITVEDLRSAGTDPVLLAPAGDATGRDAGAVRAPGMLAAHYAPDAVVQLVAPEDLPSAITRLGAGAGIGVVAMAGLATPEGAVRLAAPDTVEDYAAVLYAALREADALHLRHVVAVPPDDAGVGAAVRDRLRRAAVGSGGST